MTPKEKARELFDKFEKIIIDANADSWTKEAKQCALIAVDQVLESIPPLITLEGFGSALFENDEVVWWEQVKQEIEKL